MEGISEILNEIPPPTYEDCHNEVRWRSKETQGHEFDVSHKNQNLDEYINRVEDKINDLKEMIRSMKDRRSALEAVLEEKEDDISSESILIRKHTDTLMKLKLQR